MLPIRHLLQIFDSAEQALCARCFRETCKREKSKQISKQNGHREA